MTEIRSAGEINSVSNRLKNSKSLLISRRNHFEGKFRHIIMQRVKNNPRTIKYVEEEGSRLSLRDLTYGNFRVSRDL